MIRAICFDFDGTLAEFRGDFRQLENQVLEKLGLGQNASAIVPVFEQFALAEGAVSFQSAIEAALDQLQISIPANLPEVAAWALERYVSQIELLPNAYGLLKYFAHLPKAIITNGPSDMQWAAIRKVQIEQHFAAIVVSGDADVAVRKPNPRIFRIACERLGVAPEEVLMIGDNLRADVQGAIGFGMQGIYIEK